MSEATVTIIVAGVIQITGMIIGFLTMWVKLKNNYDKVETVESKLDANTEVTRTGTKEAANHAIIAASTAEKAKEVAADTKAAVLEKINGGMEEAVKAIVNALNAHAKNMEDICQVLRSDRGK